MLLRIRLKHIGQKLEGVDLPSQEMSFKGIKHTVNKSVKKSIPLKFLLVFQNNLKTRLFTTQT